MEPLTQTEYDALAGWLANLDQALDDPSHMSPEVHATTAACARALRKVLAND